MITISVLYFVDKLQTRAPTTFIWIAHHFHHSPTMSSSPTVPTPPLEGAKSLQERLNQLLSNLSSSIEIVKTWPSTDGDDASIHVKTTSKLIVAVWEILKALEKVEGTIKADAELRKALQNCPIPVNLLDLLDHGNGLNPGTYLKVCTQT